MNATPTEQPIVITLNVERPFTESSDDWSGRMKLHQERAQLLHELIDSLGITVQDWGETDGEYPREAVDIILALGSAGVFTALVTIATTWINRRKIREVTIQTPDGHELKLRGATADDIRTVTDSLFTPKPVRKRKRRVSTTT